MWADQLWMVPSTGGNYLDRYSGYLLPPETGNYTFWIASDDEGQFWLSSDETPDHLSLKANVPNGSWTADQHWQDFASQKSASIFLQADQPYYFVVLHRQTGGDDILGVGWSLPGQSTDYPSQIVPGSALSPDQGR